MMGRLSSKQITLQELDFGEDNSEWIITVRAHLAGPELRL